MYLLLKIVNKKYIDVWGALEGALQENSLLIVIGGSRIDIQTGFLMVKEGVNSGLSTQ